MTEKPKKPPVDPKGQKISGILKGQHVHTFDTLKNWGFSENDIIEMAFDAFEAYLLHLQDLLDEKGKEEFQKTLGHIINKGS